MYNRAQDRAQVQQSPRFMNRIMSVNLSNTLLVYEIENPTHIIMCTKSPQIDEQNFGYKLSISLIVCIMEAPTPKTMSTKLPGSSVQKIPTLF